MKKFNLMPMNLQYFADQTASDNGSAGPDDPANPNADNGSNGGKDNDPDDGEGKKYTDAEVNAIVQRKLSKWKSDETAKVEEAKKLAKMNANQKKEYELQQANKRAEDAENENKRYKMTKTARDMASEAGVAVTEDDLSHLVTEDADSTKANLEWLSGLKNRISADVKAELLKGNSPKSSGSGLNHESGNLGSELAKQSIKKNNNPYFNSEK